MTYRQMNSAFDGTRERRNAFTHFLKTEVSQDVKSFAKNALESCCHPTLIGRLYPNGHVKK